MTARSRFVSVFAICVVLTGCTRGCGRKAAEIPNTLNLVSSQRLAGVDPAKADRPEAEAQAARVYETLYQYHHLKRPAVLIPALAESLPELKEDRRTYLIRLRRGVLFHDDPCFKATYGKGRELVADDVVYSLLRVADPATGSPGWKFFEGKIAGLNDWREAAARTGVADYGAPPEGLRALDRYAVQIVLTQPYRPFPHILQKVFTSIVAREAVVAYGRDFQLHGVGTGPFQLVEFSPGARMVYSRNPTYRGDTYPLDGEPGDKEAGLLQDAGRPLPFVDRIVVTIESDPKLAWGAFSEGKIDLLRLPEQGLSPDQAEEARAASIRIETTVLGHVAGQAFNLSDPWIGKRKLVRQALSLAIPSSESGLGEIPAQGPIPPGFAGNPAEWRNPYRQWGLARSRELLRQAGYPEGKGMPEIEYVTSSERMAQRLSQAFSAIGVILRVTVLSPTELLEAIRARRFQMWEAEWAGEFADPVAFLTPFYRGGEVGAKSAGSGMPEESKGGSPASGSLSAFDPLFEQALLARGDSVGVSDLGEQMVKVIAEECPWIFESHPVAAQAIQPWLKNYKGNPLDANDSKYLRIQGR